jgi:transcriptional regulator with XRE-family HTH domain
MTGRELKQYRKKARCTQEEAARALGVSQTYLSLLETDKRPLTEKLWTKAVKKFNLPLTELTSKASEYRVVPTTDDQLTHELSMLGYSGFQHWKPSRKKNPADVLLSALNSDNRDARNVEGLPFIVIAYPDMDWNSIITTAKIYDLQNRLGFIVTLARQLAEMWGEDKKAEKLRKVEARLEPSKLEREDVLCNKRMTNAERKWLAVERPEEAKHWNLVTGFKAEHIRYAR